MRKSSLVLGSLLLAVSLTACSQSTDTVYESTELPEYNNIVSSELPEVLEISTESDTETCVYSQDSADKVKDYLSKYNYIKVSQCMENGVKDSLASVSITYDVIADTTSKITDFISTTVSENSSSSSHYIRDFANDTTYEKSDDIWSECDGEIMMIDWDIASFTSTYDIWQYLMKDYDTPIDTEGYVSGDYEYYTVTKDADNSMISGVAYDKLGTQEQTYIYHRVGENLIPSSVVVEISYYIGTTEYYVRSTIQLSNVGNTEMSMPELTQS